MSSPFVAVRALRTAINNGNAPWKKTYVTAYSFNMQKSTSGGPSKTSGKDSGAQSTVSTKNVDPPKNVFKNVDGTDVGPGASKTGEYPNPEYFSYHNMSYAEMEIVMAKLRCPQPSSNTKNAK